MISNFESTQNARISHANIPNSIYNTVKWINESCDFIEFQLDPVGTRALISMCWITDIRKMIFARNSNRKGHFHVDPAFWSEKSKLMIANHHNFVDV